MELDENLINAEWSKNNNGEPQFFIINEAIISKLCILGEDVEPCFEGAQISKVQFCFEDSFKQQLFSMMEQIKEILNEGGTPVEDMKIETPVVEEEVKVEEETTEVVDNEVVEVVETPAIEEPTEDEPIEAEAEEVEAPETEFAAKEEDDEEEEGEEKVCPECGKPESECQCDEDDEEKEDKKDKYNLDEIQEYVELSNRYSELESKYNELDSKYTSMKAEYDELVQFRHTAEKKEKQAMIDSFYMLSNEDKKEVQENIDNYSLDDIEAKLSIICVRNKVSFDLEDDKPAEGQTNPTTYNLNEVENESTPAWIKAVQMVAKEKR